MGSQSAPEGEARSGAAAGGPDDPDLPLLRRIAAGDGPACAALVDRHLPRMVALGWRMLGSRAEAEEVAQEVFLRVWQNAAGWQPKRARFSTWLHRVAVNLCLDRLRRRREVGLEEAGDPPGDDPHPGRELQRRAVAERVQAALGRLPERQRAAIVLCHFQELGNAEAAEVMEVGVDALESLLARGRRKLRALLLDDAPDLIGELE
ncbi:MAG: RNA polymerase sigma factor [Alphaproteobacteria bacterium]|nr:MAG: RNA polymerase sigma factor [Alphaproteobacteria bacterium]